MCVCAFCMMTGVNVCPGACFLSSLCARCSMDDCVEKGTNKDSFKLHITSQRRQHISIGRKFTCIRGYVCIGKRAHKDAYGEESTIHTHELTRVSVCMYVREPLFHNIFLSLDKLCIFALKAEYFFALNAAHDTICVSVCKRKGCAFVATYAQKPARERKRLLASFRSTKTLEWSGTWWPPHAPKVQRTYTRAVACRPREAHHEHLDPGTQPPH